jgi:dipeptidyl aminopeptidase/acylaminoacyl peptidase
LKKAGGTLSEASGTEWSLAKDIVYAIHDGVSLTGDLYRPAGAGPFPLIVNVHGG